MSDQPEHQVTQVQINLTWPLDTYLDAEPANAFVVTDFGENVCFAFGFVPLPPNFEHHIQDGHLNLNVERKRAFLLPKSTLLNMTTELQKFIDNMRVQEQ